MSVAVLANVTDLNLVLDEIEKSGGITVEQQKIVHDNVGREIKSGKLREVALQDMRDMGESMLRMETDFSKIGDFVKRMDGRGLVLDINGHILPYAPRWDYIHDTYTSLVAESQKQAVVLRTYMEQFLHAILPFAEDATIDVENKNRELDGFIKKLEDEATVGVENARGFLRVRQSVENFRDELKARVTEQSAQVAKEIEEIIPKIDRIERELEGSSGFFDNAWESLKIAGPKLLNTVTGEIGVVGSISGLCAMAGLVALAPAVGPLILGIGLLALGWTTYTTYEERCAHIEDLRKQLTELERTHKNLLSRQAGLQEVLVELNDLDGDFTSLVTRLTAMNRIWQLLIFDMTALKTKMRFLKPKYPDGVSMFNYTARDARVTYGLLAESLDTFALSVAPIRD